MGNFWLPLMWIVLVSSFGNFFFTSFVMSKLIGNSRANRAQYTDVSFRNLGVGIGVDGARVVELPGMEGGGGLTTTKS